MGLSITCLVEEITEAHEVVILLSNFISEYSAAHVGQRMKSQILKYNTIVD